jgi:molybdate transport system permease protein
MGLVLATTAELALVTTLLLILIATPLAWWLARSGAWWKEIVGALTALPLVLPPTVIGFYVLIALGPESPLMAVLQPFGVRTLAFTFTGLVIGSLFYSLPFAIQPLRTAFEAIGDRPLEIAATMGARPLDRFVTVALPLSRRRKSRDSRLRAYGGRVRRGADDRRQYSGENGGTFDPHLPTR